MIKTYMQNEGLRGSFDWMTADGYGGTKDRYAIVSDIAEIPFQRTEIDRLVNFRVPDYAEYIWRVLHVFGLREIEGSQRQVSTSRWIGDVCANIERKHGQILTL